jgi:hypothetical protein
MLPPLLGGAFQAMHMGSGHLKLAHEPAVWFEEWLRVRPGENFLVLFGYKENKRTFFRLFQLMKRSKNLCRAD